MFLIAGLGNPEAKYRHNRHNLGFMVVDKFAEKHGAPAFRERFEGRFSKVRVGEDDVLLLEPLTFMNLSGRSIQKALHFFKLELTSLVLVYDELDLPFGTIRIKVGGGTAGHRGVASTVECCGGTDFCRLRVGIGRPNPGDGGADHVLSDFSAAESTQLADVLERASASLTDIVVHGVKAAMNAHNQRSGAVH